MKRKGKLEKRTEQCKFLFSVLHVLTLSGRHKNAHHVPITRSPRKRIRGHLTVHSPSSQPRHQTRKPHTIPSLSPINAHHLLIFTRLLLSARCPSDKAAPSPQRPCSWWPGDSFSRNSNINEDQDGQFQHYDESFSFGLIMLMSGGCGIRAGDGCAPPFHLTLMKDN